MDLNRYHQDKNRIAELERQNKNLKSKLEKSQKLTSKYRTAYKNTVSRLADVDPRHGSNRKRKAIKMLAEYNIKDSVKSMFKSVANACNLAPSSVEAYYYSEVAAHKDDD